MKTVNKICQILAIVFGLASLALFFTQFATIVSGDNSVKMIGAELAFGIKKSVAGTEYGMAKSTHILFCFCLTALGFVMSIFSFKSKTLRYTAPGFGLVAAIYTLVVALNDPMLMVDFRPLPDVTAVKFTSFVLIAAIALFVFTALAVAYLLIDDYIEVTESKGDRLTIPKRIIRFFRDYKSEVKKIVWPTFRDVVKNTVIVLIMCLIVGIFIWLMDFGLGKLLALVLGS